MSHSLEHPFPNFCAHCRTHMTAIPRVWVLVVAWWVCVKPCTFPAVTHTHARTGRPPVITCFECIVRAPKEGRTIRLSPARTVANQGFPPAWTHTNYMGILQRANRYGPLADLWKGFLFVPNITDDFGGFLYGEVLPFQATIIFLGENYKHFRIH